MCWVIPPASVSTTFDSRIASSRVVWPWSTWPMIVTTGGRAARSSSASSYTSGSSSSSATCLMLTSRLTSVAINPTASSESDCVIVTISPRPIMILMIWAAGTPSAWDRSLTDTPEGTVTGPVGCGPGCDFGRGSVRSRACRESWRGLAAPLSMTTRRLRPPGAWRGRTGLFGRFPFEFPFESAISVPTSVESGERLIDLDGPLQRSGKAPVGDRALEADQPTACVDAPARLLGTGCQFALTGDETNQLVLGRLAAAPDTGPDGRLAHAAEGVSPSDAVSSTATGTSASTGASCGSSASGSATS